MADSDNPKDDADRLWVVLPAWDMKSNYPRIGEMMGEAKLDGFKPKVFRNEEQAKAYVDEMVKFIDDHEDAFEAYNIDIQMFKAALVDFTPVKRARPSS